MEADADDDDDEEDDEAENNSFKHYQLRLWNTQADRFVVEFALYSSAWLSQRDSCS